MKIRVSKALKLKNRLAALVREKTKNIKKENSIIKGATPKVDIRKEVDILEQATTALIEVKSAIYHSNIEIQKDVFRLAELKSELAMWNEVDCNDGNVLEGEKIFGAMTSVEKVACLKFAEIDERRKRLQSEIEEIQDKLDIHNFQTEIEVPDKIDELLN